jgi:hypothetical protein
MKYMLADRSGKQIGDLTEHNGRLSTTSVDQSVLNKVEFLNGLKERDLWHDLDMDTFLSFQCGTGGNAYSSVQIANKE